MIFRPISMLVRTPISRLLITVGLILALLAWWVVATVYQVTIYGRRSSKEDGARNERWLANRPTPDRRGNYNDNQPRYEVINHLPKEQRTVWLPWSVGIWRIYAWIISVD